MAISVTKNKKDEQTIINISSKAFPDKEIDKIDELTEGFFNVAYNITLTDGSEVILKIAPSEDTTIMTHENNIMYSEVEAMRRVAKSTKVPVAEIIFYDNSHTVCDSDYFFMKKLSGKSFSSCMETMSQEQKDNVFYLMGRYTGMINSIKGNKFGYYGQPNKQGSNWFTVFRNMIKDTYYDAERKDIDLKVTLDKLLVLLDKDMEVFEQVKEPKLVHWDIWAGNVFVNEDKITGVIDFERCLWADELMEVGFRTYDQSKAFLSGYGITELSLEKIIRAEWYDIYLFLIMSLECDYRLYDSRWAYEWGTKMLLEWVEKKECRNKSRI